jgi:hypothetical protein
MVKIKTTTEQTMIYKLLQRKLNKNGVNPCDLDGYSVLLKEKTVMSSMKEYKAPLPLMHGLSTTYTKLANSKALNGLVSVRV